jgi:hypothetical protein
MSAFVALLFKVYPVEADTGDAPKVIGQRRSHLEELLHPRWVIDAHMQRAGGVQMPYGSVSGQGGTASHGPCGGQTVFVGQLTKAAG